MDFKNLTPKNKNALIIGIAILITVITTMVGFFSTRKAPDGSALQGALNLKFSACSGSPNPVTLKKNQNGVLEAKVIWSTTIKDPNNTIWTSESGFEKDSSQLEKTYNTPGTKTMKVTVYSNGLKTVNNLECSVVVKEPVQIGNINLVPVINPETPVDQNPDQNNQGESPDPDPAPPDETNDEPSGSTEETDNSPVEEENLFDEEVEESPIENNAPQTLKPVQEILTCKLPDSTLALSKPEKVFLHCDVKPDAVVSALLIKGGFDPSQTPSADQIVKIFLSEKSYTSGALNTPVHFIIPFEGKDKFDGLVEAGDYTFVVMAVPDQTYEPDYSIIKLKVVEEDLLAEVEPPPVETDDANEAMVPESPSKPQKPQKNTVPNPPQAPPKPVEMSKCQTPYPSDIEGHWAEGLIREAYDRCIMKGFPDGTARPNQSITRAEAVALGLKTAGIPPKGCTSSDCGTKFQDIRDWQSGFIREAFDRNIVKGYSETTFAPNKQMTRAEAASLTVRLFRLPIPKNCYDPHCGAGYQTQNIFYDIKAFWQGYYIRSLTDLGQDVIQGTYPNTFEPDRPITRAELLKILLKVKGKKSL